MYAMKKHRGHINLKEGGFLIILFAGFLLSLTTLAVVMFAEYIEHSAPAVDPQATVPTAEREVVIEEYNGNTPVEVQEQTETE